VTRGIEVGEDGVARCSWAMSDPAYVDYHDKEWGRPASDDSRLFEKLVLEGFQSGLSWLTILRKRENFRNAFKGFDIAKIARFGSRDVDRLLNDAGIVRHRGKIEAAINNAKQYGSLADEFGSLAAYVWSFEPTNRPSKLDWATLAKTTTSPEAIAMSKDLKKRGWAFVGPTTVYSFLEAMGIVNDHLTGCFARAEVEGLRKAFKRPRTGKKS
jgi:DNA-3-methyladenine glycosylase I